MGISINTNIAASRASQFLASNHANLQKSLDRLSSGRRITEPADDAGGLAVAMKLNHSIQGLSGASKNIGNAISFLQVQDGILSSAGDIVSRMGELQSMSSDVMKNSTDIDNYEAEFNDLREQLNELTKSEFNGIRLFGDWQQDGAGVTAANNVFGTDDAHAGVTMNVIISEDGTTNVSIGRALLGSALMVNQDATAGDPNDAAGTTAVAFTNDGAVKVGLVKDPATADALSLDPADATPFTAAAFTLALENIATLRATNGGQVKRLQYAQADVDNKISNMTAAHSRIMDVDIAAESSNLAKQQILVQASAAMTAQANSANVVALLLLQ
jgi:flagellin